MITHNTGLTKDTFLHLTSAAHLTHAEITQHLLSIETVLLTREEMLTYFGNAKRGDVVRHHITGVQHLAKFPFGIGSIAELTTPSLRVSYRQLRDGRTFAVFTNWPL